MVTDRNHYVRAVQHERASQWPPDRAAQAPDQMMNEIRSWSESTTQMRQHAIANKRTESQSDRGAGRSRTRSRAQTRSLPGAAREPNTLTLPGDAQPRH